MSNKVTLKIEINGVHYPVSCISGEEERLIKSSKEVNKVIDDLAGISGGISETRLLVMTSLILADKLHDKQSSDETDLNLNQIEDLIDWLGKATKRMNKVAMLFENK
tara:strand:- start:74 stop:394 length:321 start_codon:yes stop_codon:yes gene_type:complete